MAHLGISFALEKNSLLTVEEFPDDRALGIFNALAKDPNLYRNIETGLIDLPSAGPTFEELHPACVNLIRFLPNRIGEVERKPPLHTVLATWPPDERELVSFEAVKEAVQ